jgi:formiminoglutamase
MTAAQQDWLEIVHGTAPLIVSIPHAGTDIPDAIMTGLVSPWLARKDCDWWIDRLYGFAIGRGATVVRTTISRTVIDVNRDPSGLSLYPGQATTELCPTTTFDGEVLYRDCKGPDADEIAARRGRYFDPYHAALAAEIKRLRKLFPRIVLYDCHSIRSAIPRLFEGQLPHFNIGTNSGSSCAPALATEIKAICDASGLTHVSNGRFKGGYITRRYGNPTDGVHAVQMELACRGYLREPLGTVDDRNWPPDFDPVFARPIQTTLDSIFSACFTFASAS